MVVNPEIATFVPGLKVLIAWNVAMSLLIEKEVIFADGTPTAFPESVVKATSA